MASDEALDELERELIDTITRIQQECQKAIEPYAKRLAEIRGRRPTRMTFSIEQARELGLIS